MPDWPRIAVVGPGAVGCFFGGMLARAGAEVVLVGRPGSTSAHLQAVRERGLVFDGVEVHETISMRVAETAPALEGAELVLFCVKTVDTSSAAEGIRPHLADGTLVVSLQNGIDNAERLRTAGVEAIPAVVIVAAAIDSPGTLRHRGRGDLIVGDSERPEDVRRIAETFERAGVPCRISDTIRHELWFKLIINSMGNSISALTHASYRELSEFEPTWRMAHEVAREGVAVAAAEGIQLDAEELAARAATIIQGVGAATSSTEQDIVHGRRTEIDSLNGYIARRGRELGVPTPINETLWALVKLREGH